MNNIMELQTLEEEMLKAIKKRRDIEGRDVLTYVECVKECSKIANAYFKENTSTVIKNESK